MRKNYMRLSAIMLAAAISLSGIQTAVFAEDVSISEPSEEILMTEEAEEEGISLPEAEIGTEDGTEDGTEAVEEPAAESGEQLPEEEPAAESGEQLPEEEPAAESGEQLPEEEAGGEIEEISLDEELPAEPVEQGTGPEEETEEDYVVPEDTPEAAAPAETVEQAQPDPADDVIEVPADWEPVSAFLPEKRVEVDPEHPDNEELFEQYADGIFHGTPASSKKKLMKKTTGDSLSGQDRIVYDAMRAAAAEIASGQRSSAQVEIPLSDLGIDAEKQYLAQDLGLEYIYREGEGDDGWNPGIGEAVAALFTYDSSRILARLWADCPYEMYWNRGGASFPGAPACEMGASFNGEAWEGYVTLSGSSLTFGLKVDSKYRADANDEYSVDTAKTGAASAAAQYAQVIVEEATGLSDYEKLAHYRDRICGLVTYNEDARQNSGNYPDGGPWALIYVFDQDPDTNVVCEGYSEAFQYLCGLTTFQNSGIYVFCPTGTMTGGTGAGPHKWNIVHMDDGKYYMADITNSDEGSVGSDGRLFLKGISGSVDGGYTLSWEERTVEEDLGDGRVRTTTYPAGSISYTYDEETRDLFTDTELTLSAEDYVPGSAQPEDPEDPAAAVDAAAKIEAVSLFLTDKIGMRIHVALDDSRVTDTDYLTFSCAGRTVRQTIAETGRDDSGRAVFTLELTARQMTDEVTFQMTVNNVQGTSSNYSIRSYADTILGGGDYSAGEKALVRAMLSYGSCTQLYAGYHTGSLAAEGLYAAGEDPALNGSPDLSAYAYSSKVREAEGGVRIRKASLLLGTDVSIRFYYEPAAGRTADDYTLTLAGDSGRTPALGYDDAQGMHYAAIEHLTPKELGTMYTLNILDASTADGSDPAATVSFGALSYCKGKLEDDSASDTVKNLCRALYYYYEAAKDL